MVKKVKLEMVSISLIVWHFGMPTPCYSTQANGAFNTIILQPLEKFKLLQGKI